MLSMIEEQYEEDEYNDDCSYEHEQYCSNYSTRVEERIGVKYREDETIDTNLNTTKALLYKCVAEYYSIHIKMFIASKTLLVLFEYIKMIAHTNIKNQCYIICRHRK